MTNDNLYIDVCFRITGMSVPLDHGYALYSSLSRFKAPWHEADWLAVHPLNGLVAKDSLHLTEDSRFRLRIPIDRLPDVLVLAGKRLRIVNGKRRSVILVGVPEVHALRPSPTLYSRCVTIKISEVEGADRAPNLEMFLSAVHKQLAERGLAGEVYIDAKRDLNGLERSRRVLHIKDRSVVGYAVTVSGLSDHDSVKLQAIGLGGRRRMGCGIFVRVKHRTPESQEAVNV
jgi:CRISPR-associated protein Cas6